MADIHLMSLRHSAFYAPYLLTISGGYLEKQGLTPHYTVATPDNPAPEAIRDGRCHVSQSAVAVSFAELEAGRECDIVHFAQINARDGFFIASRSPRDAFNWQDLVGEPFLVDHFFQPLAMLKYGLHKQGIDWQDLNIIDAGDVVAIDAAFRNGQGAFVHQQGPAPQQLEHEGIGQVVAAVGDAVGPVAFSSLCASREWLQTDMAKAFMKAYRQARHACLHTKPDKLSEKLTDFFPEIEQSVLIRTLQTYQHLGCWVPSAKISEASYTNLLEVFKFSGAISKNYPMNSCVAEAPA